MQQSLVRTTETNNNQFISPRMQHNLNEDFLSQRDNGKLFFFLIIEKEAQVIMGVV
jgi:hypothetical protein